MSVNTTRPEDVLVATLLDHQRRLDALDRRRAPAPAATLPTGPTLGQRAILTHATGVWELVWNGTAWAYVGGTDLTGYTAAEVMSDVVTYPGAPQGPTVALPRPGVYDVWAEARHRHAHTGALFTAQRLMLGAVSVGAEIAPVVPVGAQLMQGAWMHDQAGLTVAAAGNLGLAFRAPNGGGIDTFYAWRTIRVRPRTLT